MEACAGQRSPGGHKIGQLAAPAEAVGEFGHVEPRFVRRAGTGDLSLEYASTMCDVEAFYIG